MSAVGARTALVVAADAAGVDTQASAGPLDPEEALRLAIHSGGEAAEDEIVIRYIGVSARFGLGAPRGAVLAVIPRSDDRNDLWIPDVVQAFAGLAELCLVHAQRLHQAERNSDADELTRCLTRRAIERVLSAELARSHRSQAPFSIAFLDIDGFKLVNDVHGHVHGDAVLAAVGGALKNAARTTDFVGRYGGDEFLVVMPGTDAKRATAACTRTVAGAAAVARSIGLPELQLSFGTATWSPDATATALIEEADQAMFAAKRSHVEP